MRYARWILLLMLAGILTSCADSGTRGDSAERAYKDLVTINNNHGTIRMEVALTAASDYESATKQDTRNAASVSPRTSASLYGGSAAMASDGAELVFEKMESAFEAWQDFRKENSDNPVTDNSTVQPRDMQQFADTLTDSDKTFTGDIPTESVYETRFHHTTSSLPGDGYPDDGKSLVMCPGQRMNFDKCTTNLVTIPKHSDDEDREHYWLMGKTPVGDIVCTKGDKTYRYRADSVFVEGQCD